MALVATTLGGLGCSPDGPKLYPVAGKVLFDGKPAAGATVLFFPVPETALKPGGRVEADGSFTLTTYPHGKGAPAGEYKVLVYQYPLDSGDSGNLKSLLPARYETADKTPLTATVVAGSNDLQPFVLTK